MAGMTFHQQNWCSTECIDLSVTLSPDLPVTWPTLPGFRKGILNWFDDYHAPNGDVVRSRGSFYAQHLSMDEHTGTHVDFPSHTRPPAEARAGETDGPPLCDFAGPAVVIDAACFLDAAPPGSSPRIPASFVEAWEREHGRIRPREIVLIHTGYVDRYFMPLPGGNRLVRDPLLLKDAPGWPVPERDCLDLLGLRGVRHVGISSPSIGAVEDGGSNHRALVERGITCAEFLVNLRRLPPRGAIYVGLPLKIDRQSGSPVRAVAFTQRDPHQQETAVAT